MERVPGSRERLPVGIRRGCVASRPDPSDRLHAELGARPGSARAARPAPGVATDSYDEGGACRLLWPVLAHAVRVGRHRSAGPVTGYANSERTSSPEPGDRSPPETSWRRGSRSPPHRANVLSPRFRDVGAAPVLAHGLLDAGGCRRVDSHVRLAANGQDSSRQPGKSGRARESTRRDAKRHRGDFERLAERRGEQELLRVSELNRPSPRSSPRSSHSAALGCRG